MMKRQNKKLIHGLVLLSLLNPTVARAQQAWEQPTQVPFYKIPPPRAQQAQQQQAQQQQAQQQQAQQTQQIKTPAEPKTPPPRYVRPSTVSIYLRTLNFIDTYKTKKANLATAEGAKVPDVPKTPAQETEKPTAGTQASQGQSTQPQLEKPTAEKPTAENPAAETPSGITPIDKTGQPAPETSQTEQATAAQEQLAETLEKALATQEQAAEAAQNQEQAAQGQPAAGQPAPAQPQTPVAAIAAAKKRTSQRLREWESQARAERHGNDSVSLMLLARGTLEDRELSREAKKIVGDTFGFLKGPSKGQFNAQLLDLFTLYLKDTGARDPLEMIFTEMGNQKFTRDFIESLDKDKTFWAHLKTGTVVTFALGFLGMWIATPQQRAASLKKLGSDAGPVASRVSKGVNLTKSKLDNFTGRIKESIKARYESWKANRAAKTAEPPAPAAPAAPIAPAVPGVEKGKELAIIGDPAKHREDAEQAMIKAYHDFREKYHRYPLSPEEARDFMNPGRMSEQKLRIKLVDDFGKSYLERYKDGLAMSKLSRSEWAKKVAEEEEAAAKAAADAAAKAAADAEKAAAEAAAEAAKNVSRITKIRVGTGKKIQSAANWVKASALGEILVMTPGQQVVAMGRFMGISALGASGYSLLARTYYRNVANSQYFIVPENEMSQFIRPLAILQLTCRAEAMNAELSKTSNTDLIDQQNRHVNSLKSMVDEYRMLLRVAAMYAQDDAKVDEINKPIALPPQIKTNDKNTGQLTFRKVYGGDDYELPVDCTIRKDNPFKYISLLESRRAIEKVRDRLLSVEIDEDAAEVRALLAQEKVDEAAVKQKSEQIAAKVLTLEPASHNEIVVSLVPQRVNGDEAAAVVLRALGDLMDNSTVFEVDLLGARVNPNEISRNSRDRRRR